MADNPRKPFGGKGTMDGYRCELCGAWVEYRNLSKVLAHEGPLPHDAPGINAMSDLQSLPPRAAQRPRCPRCQARVTVQRTVASRPGFEHWTLRCTKCGHIHEAQVKVDPSEYFRARSRVGVGGVSGTVQATHHCGNVTQSIKLQFWKSFQRHR